MSSQKKRELSESEEKYLLAIERLQREIESEIVPLSRIAKTINVLPVSVNQMIRKLEKLGYVDYHPYKGVSLQDVGQDHSQHLLRYRRIWKVFFNQNLGIPLHMADELSRRFETITTEELVNRLYNYLGEPTITPDGDPISPNESEISIIPKIPLTNIAVGQIAIIQDVQGSRTSIKHLGLQGLKAGAQIKMLSISGRGSVLVEVNSVHISLVEEIARKVFVSYTKEKDIANAQS